MGFLNNLFGKKQTPAFNIEKAVSEYLLRLPQCNKDVVIVSPKYGEKHFICEIVVAAKDLLPWTERHAVTVSSSNKEEQAARQALPLWLRCADSSNKCASYVPHFMFKVLRLYVQNFINEGIARVFCFECQSFVSDLNRKKLMKNS